MSKKKAQRVHAKRRARLRLDGLEFNRHMRRDLVAQIQAGRLEFIERQSLRVSKFRTVLNGVSCIIVYDRVRKEIVTFLNDHAAQR